MSFKKKLFLFLAFFGIFAFVSVAAWAQETGDENPNLISTQEESVSSSTNSGNSVQIAGSDVVATEEIMQSLDGKSIDKLTGIPTPFGLFWNNLKEKVSLAFTFDATKKVEKRIFYAERKIQRAQDMIENNGDDARIQERAQNLIEQANKYIEKVQENDQKLLDKTDAKNSRIFENLTKHEANQQIVMDNLEEKLSSEKLEAFQQKRTEMEERMKKFIEKITANENISQETKDKIMENANAIINKIDARIEIMEQRAELKQRASAGDEEAAQELQNQGQTTKESIEKMKQENKQKREELMKRVKSQKQNKSE